MNNSNKFLTVAVVLLLITNIALVVFMFTGKNNRRGWHSDGRKDPSELMAKELGMTDQQRKEQKLLKEEHFKTIKPLFDSLRAAKSAFFALSKEQNVSDSLINVYHNRISEKQFEIDKLTFVHFKKVRALFTPEQQPKFDEFVQKMMQKDRRDSAEKKK